MTEKTQLQAFKDTLIELKSSLKPLLNDDVDKFVQIASNHVEQSKQLDKLLAAKRASLFAAINKAAQCRLYLDGQEASLVAFKEDVTLMVGYKGILKMVRNSGELASINAQVVYEKDTFEYFIDEKGEHIMHKPLFVKDRGKPVQTYCIARTKGTTEPYVEVMTEDEIESCKKQSAAVKFGGDTPWKGDFVDEMRKKTVIRRISKRLPMSTDLLTAIHADDPLFNAPEPEAAPESEKKTTSSRLSNATADQAAKPAPEAAKPAPEAQPAPTPAPAQEKSPVAKAVESTGDLTRYQKEGMIVDLKVVNYPATAEGQKPVTRHACKIEEEWYGTSDVTIYQKMTAAADKRVPVRLTFANLLNPAKKIIHETYEVVELPVPATASAGIEEPPI